MNVIQKNATVSTLESENPNGEFEVILSTEARDRDDENLWASEWKQPLPARIHIDGDHGRSLDKTVGSAVPRLDGNQMVAKGTFASTPYAQMVRQLVNEGHINSLSVTYSETKNQKGEGVQRELLNAAFVAIPANPEAVVLASKSATLEQEEAVRQAMSAALRRDKDAVDASGNPPDVKHDDMVQAIHDAACHLGAQCQNEIDADPGTADGANKGVEGPTGTFLDGIITEKSSSPEAGSPQEESAVSAAAEKSAAAETADNDVAREQLALRARSLAFLIKHNSLKES